MPFADFAAGGYGFQLVLADFDPDFLGKGKKLFLGFAFQKLRFLLRLSNIVFSSILKPPLFDL